MPDDYYLAPNIPFTKIEIVEGKKYYNEVIVKNTDGLEVGAKIKFRDDVRIIKNLEFQGTNAIITLDKPFIPLVISNKIIIGHYYGDRLEKVDIDDLLNKLKNLKKDSK